MKGGTKRSADGWIRQGLGKSHTENTTKTSNEMDAAWDEAVSKKI